MIRKHLLTGLALAGAAGGLLLYTGTQTPSWALTNPPAPVGAPASFADLADRLLPTVVNISSTQKPEAQPDDAQPQDAPEMPDFPQGTPFDDFFNEYMKQHQDQMQQMPTTSLGSGFIIDKDKGYIVTNNHVIKDAQEIRVTLHDNAIVNASVIGKDEKTDIALLQADLKGHGIAQASFGDSDVLRVGDWVIAIGNPFGLGGTVTAGIVSARKRDINAGPYDDFIQTDASINRGNSGGPMFNLAGQVIGINTAIFSPSGGSVGIGFAIPSTMAKSVIDQLVKYGKTRRGWLGVRIQTVTDEIAQSLGLGTARGALVASMTVKGPAEAAGIRPGDVVLTFNGRPVTDMRTLPKIVADTEIGKTVPATLWRGGKEVAVQVKVGELEVAEEKGLIEKPSVADAETPQAGDPVAELGIRVAALTPETRGQFSLPPEVTGVVVMNVNDNSDAARKGLAEGDVIVEMNQQAVKTVADIKKALADARTAGKTSILLLINRQGDVQFVAVKLPQKETAAPARAVPKAAVPAPQAPAPAPALPK